MIDLLKEYVCHSVSEREVFQTAPGLRAKVDDEGKLLPFAGNTVVFLLDDDTKTALARLQDELYAQCGDLLAERLSPDTFHMTLHDLANGRPSLKLEQDMKRMASEAKPRLADCRGFDGRAIHMNADRTFNMAHTSVVLGLEPYNWLDSWAHLEGLYRYFQQVRELDYDLTPHITLAYYKPGVYSKEDAARLRAALGPVDLSVQLKMENLVLQNFTDMNHYETVPINSL